MDKRVRYGVGDPDYRSSPKQSLAADVDAFVASGGAIKVLPTTHRPAQTMPTAEHDVRVWRALNAGSVLKVADNGLQMSRAMIEMAVKRVRRLGWPIVTVYKDAEVLVGWRRGWSD